MNRVTLTLTTAVLAVVVSLGSSFASARHGDGLLRVNIPIHEQGPDTIKLRRLIKRHRHLDLDAYALRTDQHAPGLLPWIWAVNGCASVVSAVLAPMVAISLGFQAVMLIGAGAYLGALLSLGQFWGLPIKLRGAET